MNKRYIGRGQVMQGLICPTKGFRIYPKEVRNYLRDLKHSVTGLD